MDAHDVLERIPAMAEEMQRTFGQPAGATSGAWKVHAHEPGQDPTRTVRLATYAQSRMLAIELSGLGLVVMICDPENNPRLQIWPPRHAH